MSIVWWYVVIKHAWTFSLGNWQVFIALSMTAIAISQSGALAPDSGKAKAGAASIFELLDQKSAIDSADNSGIVLENIKGDIQFHHVSFTYPTRPNVQILSDLCLTISSGKVNNQCNI